MHDGSLEGNCTSLPENTVVFLLKICKGIQADNTEPAFLFSHFQSPLF